MGGIRLEHQDFFRYFRPEQIDFISDHSEVVNLKAGDPVYYRNTKAQFIFIVLDGEVALRLPGREGVSILIDMLPKGTVFGRSVSFAAENFILNAQCTQDSTVLKIPAMVLKKVLDDDPRLGYLVQSKISETYFARYIETMKKLQAIVMTIPIDLE